MRSSSAGVLLRISAEQRSRPGFRPNGCRACRACQSHQNLHLENVCPVACVNRHYPSKKCASKKRTLLFSKAQSVSRVGASHKEDTAEPWQAYIREPKELPLAPNYSTVPKDFSYKWVTPAHMRQPLHHREETLESEMWAERHKSRRHSLQREPA